MTVQNPEMAKELRGILGIDQIKDADDTIYETLEVPEWKGAIRLGTLDAGTMIEHVRQNEGPAKFTAGIRMIVESLVDGDGRRIGKPEHQQILMKKNAVVTNRIADAILRLNGWGKRSLDYASRFKEAGTDPDKLKALADEMAVTSQRIVAAGTDPEKLKMIAEGRDENEEAAAKNGSGGTR